MTAKTYGMICPITKACEVLEPRWTIPILTEIWSGSSRFNEIRRGLGGISPTLLSKRLREMEKKGLIEKRGDPASGSIIYERTPMARELEPALDLLATWAQRNIEADLALRGTSISSLMWYLRRSVRREALPERRVVIAILFTDAARDGSYWLISSPGMEVEICSEDPGLEVDLYIETTVAALTAVSTGRAELSREQASGTIFISGDPGLARTAKAWLPRSEYAGVEGIKTVEPIDRACTGGA